MSRSASHATSVEHFLGKNLTLWTSRQPEGLSAAPRRGSFHPGTGHQGVDTSRTVRQSLQANLCKHVTIHRAPYLRETPRIPSPLTATSQPAAFSPATMPAVQAASRCAELGVTPADV